MHQRWICVVSLRSARRGLRLREDLPVSIQDAAARQHEPFVGDARVGWVKPKVGRPPDLPVAKGHGDDTEANHQRQPRTADVIAQIVQHHHGRFHPKFEAAGR